MAPALSPARGRLVVATPDLDDPNFDGTVVLLLEHGPEGSLGVVLNRPSPLTIDEAMASGPATAAGPISSTAAPGTAADGPNPAADASWAALASDPGMVFVGGPVRPNAIIALARVSRLDDPSRFEPVFADVGVVSIGDGPVSAVGDLLDLRIFAGYAGWGEEQLEGEIDAGAWFVVLADPTDGFVDAPGLLWRRVLQRQGGLFTTVTDNPVLN